MTNQVHDQKDEVKAPGMAYVNNPKIGSKTGLAEARRQ